MKYPTAAQAKQLLRSIRGRKRTNVEETLLRLLESGATVRLKNPPAEARIRRPIVIGDEVGGIWYRKGQDHACDPECQAADHWYEHIFDKKIPVIGRPDGKMEI